jgi:hypothetical protein
MGMDIIGLLKTLMSSWRLSSSSSSKWPWHGRRWRPAWLTHRPATAAAIGHQMAAPPPEQQPTDQPPEQPTA